MYIWNLVFERDDAHRDDAHFAGGYGDLISKEARKRDLCTHKGDLFTRACHQRKGAGEYEYSHGILLKIAN